ncbi:MAG: hypothetical protein ACOCT9_02500 [archaeon]
MGNENKENWIWMPHPAHLIVGRDCKFHLATYVGRYIVSTVGEYWPDRQVREIHAEVHDPDWYERNKHLKGDNFDSAFFKRFGWLEIGAGATYETMVFKAKKSTEDDCSSCPYVIESGQDIDAERYNDGKSAYEGHLKMCKKWSRK